MKIKYITMWSKIMAYECGIWYKMNIARRSIK